MIRVVKQPKRRSERLFPPSPYINVVVYYFPFEGENEDIVSEMKKFGKVNTWRGMPDVFSGSRVVVREKEIPRFVSINGIRCKV